MLWANSVLGTSHLIISVLLRVLLHGVGWELLLEELGVCVTLGCSDFVLHGYTGGIFLPKKAGCACISARLKGTYYDDLYFVSSMMSRRWVGLEDSLLSTSNDGSSYLARLRAKKGRCLTYCIMTSA